MVQTLHPFLNLTFPLGSGLRRLGESIVNELSGYFFLNFGEKSISVLYILFVEKYLFFEICIGVGSSLDDKSITLVTVSII